MNYGTIVVLITYSYVFYYVITCKSGLLEKTLARFPAAIFQFYFSERFDPAAIKILWFTINLHQT